MTTHSPQGAQYDPYAGQHAAPVAPRKPRRWPWVLGIVVAFLLGTGVGGASGRPAPAASSTPQAVPLPVVTAPAAPAVVAPAAPAAVEPAGPATTVSDGSYEVGTDMAAGRYKTSGPDKSSVIPNCYWGRSKDDSGNFSAIIANDNVQGPGTLTVKAGEFVKLSGGCTWAKQ